MFDLSKTGLCLPFFCAKSTRRVETANVSAIYRNKFYVILKSNFCLFCQGSSSVAEKCAMLQPFVNNAISGTFLQKNETFRKCKHSVGKNVQIQSLSVWLNRKRAKKVKTSTAQYFKPSISLCRCFFFVASTT